MVGQTAVSWVGVEPKVPPEIFHHHTLLHCTAKEVPGLLKNVLDDTVKNEIPIVKCIFLTFCVMKWKVHIKQKTTVSKALVWIAKFFCGTSCLLERMKDIQVMVIQTLILGRHSLENETEEACHFKQLTVFVANDKTWASKRKWEFGQNCICYHELDSLPILNHFSDDCGDIIFSYCRM